VLSGTASSDSPRERAQATARRIQEEVTRALETLDGERFREDLWTRPGGGGGRTRVLSGGRVFEKAGVNFSAVEGELEGEYAARLPGRGSSFFATGVSVVIHPWSPRVPTVHANFRYLERGDQWWFGGGSDLTPYRLYPEDARHFHRVWKQACDRHAPDFYPRFKKWCDEYFFLPHRGEARGIGGIFFDDLSGDRERLFRFWEDAASSFLPAYLPIVERRKDEAHGEEERTHQLRRRGRYVEFNLLHDRGTAFGLRTQGRIESILMSLPPLARWDYDTEPPAGADAELLRVLKEPRDWLGDGAALPA
jgi:coproporphyrinogen III oxidase